MTPDDIRNEAYRRYPLDRQWQFGSPETQKKIDAILEWARERREKYGTVFSNHPKFHGFHSADLVSLSGVEIPDAIPMGWEEEERVVWGTGDSSPKPLITHPIVYLDRTRDATVLGVSEAAARILDPKGTPHAHPLKYAIRTCHSRGRDLVIYDENLCEVDRYRCGDYVEER